MNTTLANSDPVLHDDEVIMAHAAPALSPESVLRRDERLAKRTTLRVGGPADYYAEPASEKDLAVSCY